MRRTWLVQRLHRPDGDGPMAALGEAFSFGGGKRNGGLTDDAMSLLRGVFSFDYMGAAEFEFGAVPDALRLMASARLAASTFDIDGRHVYVVGPEGEAAVIEERMRSWLLPPGERPHMKERPKLDAALSGEEWAPLGWLELDNGWFATVDEAMFKRFAGLFGVVIEALS